MEKEEFLMRLTGGEDEDAAVAPATPRLQYYNKVGGGDSEVPPDADCQRAGKDGKWQRGVF